MLRWQHGSFNAAANEAALNSRLTHFHQHTREISRFQALMLKQSCVNGLLMHLSSPAGHPAQRSTNGNKKEAAESR